MYSKNFKTPDEVRELPKMRVELLDLNGKKIMKGTYEPGWKWSEHMKPTIKTDSCQVHHEIYMISGKMMVQMNDGTQKEAKAGDAVILPPGHNAWVVGNEPVVLIDFTGGNHNYAKPA